MFFFLSAWAQCVRWDECTHAPSSVPNHHNHRNHHKPFLASVSSFLVSLVDEMMTSGQLSASQRRRGRRLRAMLRHEQLSIVLALAAALHHSAGSREKVEIAVQRRPSGTDDREGEVHEKNDAPRRQNTPHPGERPDLLAEPGPQRSDRTVRRFSGEAPLLIAPSLAGGDFIDSATVSFLVQNTLTQKEEEEEEKEKKEEEEKDKAMKAKRSPRRFSGHIWMLPTAGGIGFVESDDAKAALGSELLGALLFFRRPSGLFACLTR